MNAREILAKNVRKRRAYLGLSQDELGARANSSGNYIGMIERVETSASLDMIEVIAAELNIDVHELLDPDFNAKQEE